jgi:hypothetical protein
MALESRIAAVLLPLWQSPQPIEALVKSWQRLKPIHPITLEPIAWELAFQQIIQFLIGLETNLYVLIEQRAECK